MALLGDESRSDLRAVYGNCFVNPGNATLFIVLTRCDAETITMFNEALNPLPGVHLVYRTGPVTYEELERYMDELVKVISKLPRDVVEVNSGGITENATIFVGMGKITTSSVNAFADAIRGIVPEELIVIRHDYAAQLASFSVEKGADGPPGPAADASSPGIIHPIDMGILAVSILLPLLLLAIARKNLSSSRHA
jgi:hypothetical protein